MISLDEHMPLAALVFAGFGLLWRCEAFEQVLAGLIEGRSLFVPPLQHGVERIGVGADVDQCSPPRPNEPARGGRPAAAAS